MEHYRYRLFSFTYLDTLFGYYPFARRLTEEKGNLLYSTQKSNHFLVAAFL